MDCQHIGCDKTPKKGKKYCSHRCYSDSKKGKKHSWGNKIAAKLKGVPKSKEHVENASAARRGKPVFKTRGKRHHAWKGDKAHYDSIHDWVKRYKGVPKNCSHCLTTEARVYHWANVSGEYKRDLTDWVRLCVPCHSKMDKGRNSIRNKFNSKRQFIGSGTS